jgi:hypothetical protein
MTRLIKDNLLAINSVPDVYKTGGLIGKIAITKTITPSTGYTFANFATTLNYPVGIQVNDLVIYVHGDDNNTINLPAGFTNISAYYSGAGAPIRIAYRVIDGTEGSSFAIGTSGGATGVAMAFLIRGATLPPTIQVAAIDTSSGAVNPPSLTTTAGQRKYSLAFGIVDDILTAATTTAPSGYTLIGAQDGGVQETSGVTVAAAYLDTTVSVLDPGAFGVSALAAADRSTGATVSVLIGSTPEIAPGTPVIVDGGGLYKLNANFNPFNVLGSYFAATGGTTIDSGGYRYHVFTANGTFAVTSGNNTVEWLVVAGGGSGGSTATGVNDYGSAGGGAGGLVAATRSMTNGDSWPIVIGAGGAGLVASTTPRNGNAGNNSTVNSTNIIALGGGFGAGANPAGNGGAGGSGGGARGGSSAGSNGTAGTADAGTGTSITEYAGAGGTGFGSATVTSRSGGGGGGSGAAGSNSAIALGGNGGNGTTVFSAWGLATSTGQLSGGIRYYAGGGGGTGGGSASTCGTGGLGGGTAGNSGSVSATANTGGASGGSRLGGANATGAGGSGIVIARYLL